jgi:hypothetical protein
MRVVIDCAMRCCRGGGISHLSVCGATLPVMDTLSNIPDTSYEIPLSEADQTALRPALLRDLGAMPFEPGALISRRSARPMRPSSA